MKDGYKPINDGCISILMMQRALGWYYNHDCSKSLVDELYRRVPHLTFYEEPVGGIGVASKVVCFQCGEEGDVTCVEEW